MAARKRGLPYLYVTWLAKALANEKACLYSVWFRSRFSYEKFEEQAGDLVKWNRDHSKLMAERRRQLEAQGYTCRVEEANAFKLEGSTAIVAGKMDLVATKDDHMLIVDGKTGRDRESDVWQVLLYLWTAPKIWRVPANLEGEVHYSHGDISLTPDELNDERVTKIVNLIKVVAADAQPTKTPTRDNCRFCNIGPVDCPQRVMKEQTTLVGDF